MDQKQNKQGTETATEPAEPLIRKEDMAGSSATNRGDIPKWEAAHLYPSAR